MIYLFYGSDVERVRRQAFSFVEAARKRQPDLAYIRLAREDLTPSLLEEVASAGGLFVSRLLVLLDDPFPAARKSEDDEDSHDLPETGSPIEGYFDALAKSDNAIILLAPKLNAAKAKKLAARVEKEYKFDKANAAADSRGFNTSLVNALGARDSQKLWLEIVRALETGDPPEAVHGLLHWKARDILEKKSRTWTPAESRALSLALISLLMSSRRTGVNLSESLERFALSI